MIVLNYNLSFVIKNNAMKNPISILFIIPLFISCGGDNSSAKETASDEKPTEKIICEGEKCQAPKCDDIDAFSATEKEDGRLNRREIPRDHEGMIKTCYPNGNIKMTVSWKNGWKFGDLFMYREDGSLEKHEIWSIEEGKTMGKMSYSEIFRPDGTCIGSSTWNNAGFHGEQIQCGEKGEVRTKAIWDNGEMVSCEGPDCR